MNCRLFYGGISLPDRASGLLTLVLSIVLLAIAADAGAQPIRQIRAFDDGTRLLRSGDFAGAVAAFEEAEASGLVSGALYYNRAVAHYRLDEIGKSVQYFERAARLLDDQTRVRHSLDIVSTRLQDSFSELPVPIWKRLQRAIVSVISVTGLMVAGVGVFLALSGMVLANIMGYWSGAWFRRARLLGVVLSIVFLGAAFTSSIWPAYPPEAVILSEEADLVETPDAEAGVVEEVHEGLVVRLLSQTDEWALVQLPNGVRGWVETPDIGKI